MLTFENARPTPLPNQAPMAELSFQLQPGELLLVRMESGNEQLPLADAAAGLLPLETGRVLFQDQDWSRIDQERALRLRAQIGRVFDWHGWVSNLDVIENITLAQRHHTRRPLEEIADEAQELARAFDLPEVPRGRPAAVPHRDLRRAEWVRAFIGRPALVCLERPGLGVAGEHLVSLARAVHELCARGGAALWLAADEREWRAATADRLRRCAMQGQVLQEQD